MRKGLALGSIAVFLVTIVSLALPPYQPPNIEARVVAVVDGDTIDVVLNSVPDEYADELTTGKTVRIRYIGINAPEADTQEGQIATELNASLVEGKTVYLELDNNHWDKYHRLLAYVYLDPYGYLMVNATLATVPIIEPMLFSDTPRYNRNFDCLSQCPPPIHCYSWEEAADHVGETIWVCGVVKSTKRLSYGRIFINIGNPYPETPRFTIMIRERSATPLFDDYFGLYFEKSLVGKVVYVYGKITLYEGSPEVQPTSPDQLRMEPPPECQDVSCQ